MSQTREQVMRRIAEQTIDVYPTTAVEALVTCLVVAEICRQQRPYSAEVIETIANRVLADLDRHINA